MAQRREWVARGNELVCYVSFEVRCGDSAHHAVPLDFLRAVEFVPAGNSAGVEVAHPFDIFLDGGYEVTFHDLHVIDVVEQLHARRVDRLYDL